MSEQDVKSTAIYIRVSTDDQIDGMGATSQKIKAEAQAVVKDWTVYKIYEDLGVSGTIPAHERPAFSELISDAEDGHFEAVIALSFDRVGRKTQIVLDTINLLTDMGIEFVSCKENLDTSTPQGRFVLTMFAAISELELGVITQRLTDGRNARGKEDGEKGGAVHYGYQRVLTAERGERNIKVDPNTVPYVKRIFEMHDDGHSYRSIANYLNKKNAPLPTKRAKQWWASSVRTIVKNRKDYEGGNRNDSPITFPAIIEGNNE